MRILIADDDRILVHMLSSCLRSKGFSVTVAFDAVQAWMAAVRTPPDAIILDIQMPGGTGLAVLKQLRSSVKTSQIPVLVLSGSIEPEADEMVKGLGADEYLPKPVDLPRLYKSLCRLLGMAIDTESKVT